MRARWSEALEMGSIAQANTWRCRCESWQKLDLCRRKWVSFLALDMWGSNVLWFLILAAAHEYLYQNQYHEGVRHGLWPGDWSRKRRCKSKCLVEHFAESDLDGLMQISNSSAQQFEGTFETKEGESVWRLRAWVFRWTFRSMWYFWKALGEDEAVYKIFRC